MMKKFLCIMSIKSGASFRPMARLVKILKFLQKSLKIGMVLQVIVVSVRVELG